MYNNARYYNASSQYHSFPLLLRGTAGRVSYTRVQVTLEERPLRVITATRRQPAHLIKSYRASSFHRIFAPSTASILFRHLSCTTGQSCAFTFGVMVFRAILAVIFHFLAFFSGHVSLFYWPGGDIGERKVRRQSISMLDNGQSLASERCDQLLSSSDNIAELCVECAT